MNWEKLLRPGIWSYILQRFCRLYSLRRSISASSAATKPRHKDRGLPSTNLKATELEQDGITMLKSFVDTETIARIKEHLKGALLSERFGLRRRDFIIDDIPYDVHVAEYATEWILRSPDVVDIANHPTLVDIAAKYLGCKPTISSVSVWLALPGGGLPQGAENFHRDVDEWKFVKFFLYLTDIDADAGPMWFVRGSHRDSKLIGFRRIGNHEVADAYPREDILQVSGAAGDAFLADTYGLHKGQEATKNSGLIFQVQYSINPIAIYDYDKINMSLSNIDPYVNRLYLDIT